MNVKEIVSAIQAIEENRKISKEIVVDALKEALAKAYRRQIDIPDAMISVDVDDESGEVSLYQEYTVVEEVEDDELEISVEDARERNVDINVGETYRVLQEIDGLGRAAALLAKNVMKQKIREAEKQGIYDEYIDKLDEMVFGRIESVEDKFVVVNLGKTLAMMPKAGQIPGERYIEGENIRVVITEVNKETKGAQVLVSRSDAKFVKRLFEKEVPEIFQGVVEIKAIAREAGERTKMAVYSYNEDIDPIGACIGPRGSRVQVVIEELKGEKIDIFEWSENPIELIRNSLAPAQILAVYPSTENNGLVVVVDDTQLSLAIGKKGKNARLAVRLTGTRIDIKAKSAIEALGIDFVALMAAYESELTKKRVQKELEALEKEATTPIVSEPEIKVEVTEEAPNIVVDEPAVETTEPVVIEAVEKVLEVESEPVVDEAIELKKRPKKELKPRTDYVSKLEKLAEVKKVEEPTARYRKKTRDDEEKRINTSELLRQKDYEIKPEYSEEELEEIRIQHEAEESKWDDYVDYDEYDNDDFYENE